MIDINNKGIRVWETAEIKTQVEAVFLAALGPDASLDPTSVNGQLITALSQVIQSNAIKAVELFNNYSLEKATGVFLDYIAQLFQLTRKPGMPSEVIVNVLGESGTSLPYGFLVSDGVKQFELRENAVISPGVSFKFYCTEIEPYYVAPNSVDQIVAFAPGLESVNNPLAGITGSYPESDVQFRNRIKQSQYKNANGLLSSLRSALFEISNDALLLENNTDETVVTQGVSILPHSIYVCSYDGTDLELATAIYLYKSMGCGTVGNVSFTMPVEFGLISPLHFNRPALERLYINVEVYKYANMPGDLEDNIRDIVISQFSKDNRIGGTLYGSKFVQSLVAAGIQNMNDVLFSEDGSTFKERIVKNADQLATLQRDDIKLVLLED